MITAILILMIALIIFLFIVFFVIKKWNYMPLVLLVLLWYIPRQTVPDGLLEDFVFLRWMSIVLILLVGAVQLIRMAICKKNIRLGAIFIPLVLYMIFSFISGIVNNVRAVELLGSLILYIRYPLLFIILINMDIQIETAKKFLVLFLFLLSIQIPECLYRFFVMGVHGDFISFTLGPWGHFDLGVYAIYGAAFVVARNMLLGVKWYLIVFVALLLMVSLIGEIKALAISIPIISILTIYATFRKQKVKKYFLMIFIPVVFIVMIYGALSMWDKVHVYSGNTLAEYLERISFFIREPTILVEAERVDVSSSRFLGSAFVWNYLRTNPRTILMGLGPGALLAGNFLGTPGRIFEEVPYLNQLAVILGETGIVGLLIFFLMLFCLLRRVVFLNRTVEDTHIRIMAAAFIGMWVFYALLGPFYDLVWRHDSPNLIFYFFAAFLHGYAYQHEQ